MQFLVFLTEPPHQIHEVLPDKLPPILFLLKWENLTLRPNEKDSPNVVYKFSTCFTSAIYAHARERFHERGLACGWRA